MILLGVDDELIGTGSSDGDAAGTEPEDDESETENEDSARYASNRLLHSESEDNDDHDFLFSDSSEDDSDDSESDVIIESSTEILSTLNLVKIVGGHHLNMAIRVCGLWLVYTVLLRLLVLSEKKAMEVVRFQWWEQLKTKKVPKGRPKSRTDTFI